jgi:hypothetical protein
MGSGIPGVRNVCFNLSRVLRIFKLTHYRQASPDLLQWIVLNRKPRLGCLPWPQYTHLRFTEQLEVGGQLGGLFGSEQEFVRDFQATFFTLVSAMNSVLLTASRLAFSSR